MTSVRTCCCTGYLTNPGGRCCMDFQQGQTVVSDRIILPEMPQLPELPELPEMPVIPTASWQCGGCGRFYAPWVDSCDCQAHRWVSNSTTFKIHPDRD